MKPKTVKESRERLIYQTLPQDANVAGNVHGGTIMRLIDTTASVVALRHCRPYVGNVVTARIDKIEFLAPAHIGDLVIVKASLNYAGRTSMEVGVKVEIEDLRSGQTKDISSSYVVFVALDKYGKPTPVPPVMPKTKEEKRRFQEGQERAFKRKQERKNRIDQ